MATWTPCGSCRESSILATVPTLAYLPETRGTSRHRRSPSRAAAMAAAASSRYNGMVTTMAGSTTALFSGNSGINSVLSSGIASILLGVLIRDNLRDLRFMPKMGVAKRAALGVVQERLGVPLEPRAHPASGRRASPLLAATARAGLAPPVHLSHPLAW